MMDKYLTGEVMHIENGPGGEPIDLPIYAGAQTFWIEFEAEVRKPDHWIGRKPSMHKMKDPRLGGEPNTPGMLLRTYRYKYNIPQAQMGDRLGCKQNLISLWERGTRKIPERVLTYIAEEPDAKHE